MPHFRVPLPLRLTVLASVVALAACGGSNDSSTPTASNTSTTATASIPAPPADPGFVDNAAIPDVPAFVDTIATNQRGDARYATLATNAGVRVVSRFLDIWQPLTEIVDAGVSAPANGSFPAVVQSTWTGLPNDGTPGGAVVNSAVHAGHRDVAEIETAYHTLTPLLGAGAAAVFLISLISSGISSSVVGTMRWPRASRARRRARCSARRSATSS